MACQIPSPQVLLWASHFHGFPCEPLAYLDALAWHVLRVKEMCVVLWEWSEHQAVTSPIFPGEAAGEETVLVSHSPCCLCLRPALNRDRTAKRQLCTPLESFSLSLSLGYKMLMQLRSWKKWFITKMALCSWKGLWEMGEFICWVTMQISQLNLHSAPEGISGLLKERGFDTIFKKEREQRNSRISYRFSALLFQVSLSVGVTTEKNQVE